MGTSPTFLTLAELAAHLHKSQRAIYLWHDHGLIDGYDDNGTIKYNLEAVELAMKMNPRKMRDGRKRGTKGIVKSMPIQAVSE